MKLRISVTKEILEKSKYCEEATPRFNDAAGRNCAISLAVRDVLPQSFVSQYFFYPMANSWSDLYDAPHTMMPAHVTQFIKNFDRCTPQERVQMQPISFEIEVPDEVINRINISEITELLKDHPTLQIV